VTSSRPLRRGWGRTARSAARTRPSSADFDAELQRAFEARPSSRERRFWQRWSRTLRLLRPIGSFSAGNAVEIFTDGDALFDSLWSAIAGAEESVLLNTYILDPDGVGERTRDLLAQAAVRGCRVLLVYDAFGSSRLTESFLRPLHEAGAEVVAYNPLLRMRSPISRLVRDHRKITVVDGRVAYCGGMNVAEDYAGKRYGSSVFRDSHLRLVGPCVRDLAELLIDVVARQGVVVPTPPEPDGVPGGAVVQVLESNVPGHRREIQKALALTLRRAVKRCYATSPYFVPPSRLMRDLRNAARRGVDVRVLTAGRSDVPLAALASRHLYGRLLRGGVRIYEMRQRTLHAKSMAIDGVYGSVGSFNLDTWSYRRNLEVNVAVIDRALAEHLERQFLEDLELSQEVTLESWERRGPLERVLNWLAYRLMRL
jgi:cardiolipin synthase